LVSDCFTAYDAKAFEEWLKQKCFAHLLREISGSSLFHVGSPKLSLPARR